MHGNVEAESIGLVRMTTQRDGVTDRCLEPPMDPPPFQPATIRKCIRTSVRVCLNNSHEVHTREVLILTPLMTSTEALLERHSSHATQPNGIDIDDDADDSMEDKSSSSSSLSSSDFETTDEDEGSSNDEFSDMRESESTNNGIRSEHRSNGSAPQPQSPRDDPSKPPAVFRMQAYLLSRQALFENRHGVSTTYIYHARILRQGATNVWVTTGEECAVKAVSWNAIRASRNRMSEDILKEVAALQYVSDWHRKAGLGPLSALDTHVMTADVIMSNETHLLVVMPFCPGGDLCEKVAESPQMRLTETEVSRRNIQQAHGIPNKLISVEFL